MKLALAVLACLVLAACADVPALPLQFKAAIKSSMTIKMSMPGPMNDEHKAVIAEAIKEAPMQEPHRRLLQFPPPPPPPPGPGGDMDTKIVTEGIYFYDYPNGKERTDMTHLYMSMMGMKIDIAAGGTQVLRYDQHKNFTYYKEGDKEICFCSPLTQAQNPMFIPSTAKKTGTEEYTSPDGNKYQLDVYEDSLIRGSVDMPGTGDSGSGNDIGMSFKWKISGVADGKPVCRQFVSSFKIGGMMEFEFAFDLWSYVVAQPTRASFLVSDVCADACPAPPKARTDPPAVPDCPTTVQGCQCPASADELKVCKPHVTYPYDSSLVGATTDSFVGTTISTVELSATLLGGSISEQCKTSLTKFYCEFYFQRCSKGGVLYLPKQPDLSSCPDGLVDLSKTEPAPNANSLTAKLASFFQKGSSSSSEASFSVRSGQVSDGNSDAGKRDRIGSAFQAYQAIFAPGSDEAGGVFGPEGSSAGAIVGGIFGGLACVGLIGGGYWYYNKKKQEKAADSLIDDEAGNSNYKPLIDDNEDAI